jgi:hypothetical protein
MGLCALHMDRLLKLDRERAERAPSWSSCLGAAE